MSGTHDAEFYVQIEPEFYGGTTPRVREIKAVRMTQKRPFSQRGGTALVKLTVRIPDGAFLPLAPEAVVVVPEGMVTTAPIEVTVQDPQ